MKGAGGPFAGGTYGTKGVANINNNPGARYMSASWTDAKNNLWLFGGFGNDASGAGILNDLWKYDIATNLWTWMSGDTISNSMGFFGTLGIPSVNNFPPSRSGETATSWCDNNNNLWLFGGSRDDLWRYTITTNEWTWMNGSQAAGAGVVFGVKGIPANWNTPGARSSYTHWKDNPGNLWLFGGSATNDMWKYDVTINQWTWMSGTNLFNNTGNYPGLCINDTAAVPTFRVEHKCCWTDACGNFWLMGGNNNAGCINDLWRFNPVTLEWTWVNGNNITNTLSTFGTLGVSSATNVAGSRMGHSGWVDGNNNLWLFGGSNASYSIFMADLWRFVPDPACTPCTITPIALYNAPNHICPGTCTDFTNLSVNATSYLWTFAGANPSSSTDINPSNICYNTPGMYSVSLIATNATGSDTLTLNNYITVFPSPPPQGISQSGDTLFANPGASGYQWYFNGTIISGATNYFYVAQASGDFNVVATDANGCEVEAVIFNVVASVNTIEEQEILIFPNPVEDKVKIHKSEVIRTATEISIYNMMGEIVWKGQQEVRTRNQDVIIDVTKLPSGIYYLELISERKTFRSKFVKAEFH